MNDDVLPACTPRYRGGPRAQALPGPGVAETHRVLGQRDFLVETVPTGASSIIFWTFMKLMFGTVLFGLAVGLVLVPTLLAAMGPRRGRAGK